jgi:hypothetical protein
LDEGFVLLVPDEDRPTNVVTITPVADQDGETCKALSKRAIPINASVTLIPYRLEDTSARSDACH